MNPGKLKKRITFLKREFVENTIGEEVEGHIDYKSVWCAAYSKGMRELNDLDKIRNLIIYKFIFRDMVNVNISTKDINLSGASSCVRYKKYILDIISIRDLENGFIEIVCEGEIK